MNRSKLISLFSLFIVSVLMAGCFQEDQFDPYKQYEADIQRIDDYLEAQNIDFIKLTSGVRLVIDSLGSRPTASYYIDNDVEVDYKGFIFPDTQNFFEEGTAEGPIDQFIPGWLYALTALPEGSKADVYIPSGLAYGQPGRGQIPSNAILRFEIEFLELEVPTAENDKFKTDTAAIGTYLREEEIVYQLDTLSGVRYVVTETGMGGSPTLYDEIKLNYEVRTLVNDSTVFRKMDNNTSYSMVVDYLRGMHNVLQKLHEGGKATLYIPSKHGFAAVAQPALTEGSFPAIPANSNLIMEIELVDIKN